MTSAQGQDRSSYQPVTNWHGLQFGFVKATESTSWRDPTFGANWANLKAEGLVRMAYHFFHPDVSPIDQANFFREVVQEHGFEPGDGLICDSETPWGNISGSTRLFMDELKPVGMDKHPLLVYSDISLASQMGSCGEFGLYIAHPGSAPAMPIGPWKTWDFWQWGQRGVDQDAYNGTPEQLTAWIDGFKKGAPAPKPPTPTTISIPEDGVPQLNNGAGAQSVISFAAGSQQWISFGCDASHVGQAAPTLRVAAHSHADGWDQIEEPFTIPANGKAAFTFVKGDVDMVSIIRVGSPDVAIGYNVTNPAAA